MPAASQDRTSTGATDVTGLVLAGGQGSRMGGIDKGLVDWNGLALALHAARRLAPQVSTLRISANRHLEVYRSWGWPVDGDGRSPDSPDSPDSPVPHHFPVFRGPLAGVRAGLHHCQTPLLMTVPCDVPFFPADLVARMVDALEASGAHATVASGWQEGRMQPQPVFALLRVVRVRASLDAWLAAGEARVMPWLKRQCAVEVRFDRPTDDPLAFCNVNTADDMQGLREATRQT